MKDNLAEMLFCLIRNVCARFVRSSIPDGNTAKACCPSSKGTLREPAAAGTGDHKKEQAPILVPVPFLWFRYNTVAWVCAQCMLIPIQIRRG